MRARELARRIAYEEDGTSAIEAAICFPIVLILMFGCFQYGLFYNNATDLSHIFQETSRDVKLMTNPSTGELLSLYQSEISHFNPDQIALNVARVDRYGESFAEVSMIYSYTLDIPFLRNYAITSRYNNLVMLSTET